MPEMRYYRGDPDDLNGMSVKEIQGATVATYTDVHDEFRQYLNDALDPVRIVSAEHGIDLEQPAGDTLLDLDADTFYRVLKETYVLVDVLGRSQQEPTYAKQVVMTDAEKVLLADPAVQALVAKTWVTATRTRPETGQTPD